MTRELITKGAHEQKQQGCKLKGLITEGVINDEFKGEQAP